MDSRDIKLIAIYSICVFFLSFMMGIIGGVSFMRILGRSFVFSIVSTGIFVVLYHFFLKVIVVDILDKFRNFKYSSQHSEQESDIAFPEEEGGYNNAKFNNFFRSLGNTKHTEVADENFIDTSVEFVIDGNTDTQKLKENGIMEDTNETIYKETISTERDDVKSPQDIAPQNIVREKEENIRVEEFHEVPLNTLYATNNVGNEKLKQEVYHARDLLDQEGTENAARVLASWVKNSDNSK